jgi:hypothetical protein
MTGAEFVSVRVFGGITLLDKLRFSIKVGLDGDFFFWAMKSKNTYTDSNMSYLLCLVARCEVDWHLPLVVFVQHYLSSFKQVNDYSVLTVLR